MYRKAMMMIALELYNGRHTCRPLETDPDLGAMLLERIVPGHCLRQAVPADKRLGIGARMVEEDE